MTQATVKLASVKLASVKLATVFLLLTIVHTAVLQSTRQCPPTWSSQMTQTGEQTCLFVSRERTTWIGAAGYCAMFGSHLVEIGSMDLNMKIQFMINAQKPDKYWIGLTDILQEGAYTWMSSKALPFVWFFAPGQQMSGMDKNCANLNEKGLWHVEPCKAEYPFICQRSP